METFKKILFLSTISFLFTGCVTTRKDFKANTVKENEATIVGQIKVLYNKKIQNPDCLVCFNSSNSSCQKLLSDGIIVMKLPQGEASLRRVECRDGSPQHYNITNTSLLVKPGVNYIGDITIRWENEGGFKISSMFGAVGAVISESKNDGSVDVIAIDGDASAAIKEYEEITKTKSTHVQKNILKVTRQ